MLARYDEQMNGRPGTDVFERHDRIVLVDNIAFYSSFDDAAKETVAHFAS
jgi:hypothetical protein